MIGPRILVVDDQPENLQLLRLVLAGAGYDVVTAASGEEALTLLRRTHPRLILMDLQLPGMGGLALTSRLKSEPATRSIVVVAITAYAMVGDEAQASGAGCDGYITKPIDTRVLPHLIERYLARHPQPQPAMGNGEGDVAREGAE